MKNLVKNIYNKISVALAVVSLFLIFCEAENEQGMVLQIVAVVVFGSLCYLNRHKWFAE